MQFSSLQFPFTTFMELCSQTGRLVNDTSRASSASIDGHLQKPGWRELMSVVRSWSDFDRVDSSGKPSDTKFSNSILPSLKAMAASSCAFNDCRQWQIMSNSVNKMRFHVSAVL